MNLFGFKYNIWLFFVLLLACFTVSVWVRFQQFETWKKTPHTYFVEERPMMTTLDAPYWLRMAREYNEGVYKQRSGLQGYPEGTETFQELSLPLKYKDTTTISSSSVLSFTSEIQKISYNEIPLLSFLIAHLAQVFDYNYYLTGTLMIPVLASLFILPLGIFFFRINLPASGLLGGLIGTFASGYYLRSSIGRIDTDMLNLFFPGLVGLFILLAGKAKTKRNVLLCSIGAGLSAFLFQWWYDKPGFTWAYFLVLVFSLFIQRIEFRTILLSTFLFLLCLQPLTFMKGSSSMQVFLKDYFSIEESVVMYNENETTRPASFPNTMSTISEVSHASKVEVLQRVLSNTTLSMGGLLAFFVLAVFRWRLLLALAPMFFLGMLSFQSSNRFIMYLGPFIGIGLGWILQLGIEYAFYFFSQTYKDSKKAHNVSKKSNHSNTELKEGIKLLRHNRSEEVEFQNFKASKFQNFDWLSLGRQGAIYLGLGVFFWLIAVQTAISFVPGPSINTRLYATFLEVKKRVPADAALLTWWDYGYAITDATGLATFHDGGGLQLRASTYFTARGLLSADQKELYDITQYLSTEGNVGISNNNTSPEAVLEAVRNSTHKPWNPIYLFFTVDMTGKYGAISKLGSWDIVNGGSKVRVYQNLFCNKITNEEMNCRGAKIDLQAGKINNQLPLKRMVFIRDGQVLREQEFLHAQGYTLQLIVVGRQIVEVQLIEESVFRSNYNQMFLLGRYRKDLYEETYNAFPFSRLYKIKF